MRKGKLLRIFDTEAVFENCETGNCLIVKQSKDINGSKIYERKHNSQLSDYGSGNGTSQILPIEAIFGFYDLLSGSYVACLVESESYVAVGNINIRKAKKIVIVPLFKNGRLLSENKQKDEDKYLELLNSSFSQHHFFFSFVYDLTLTQQRLSKYPLQKGEFIFARVDLRFFWNYKLVLDLLNNNAEDWVVPVMSGYIEIRPECVINDTKFTLLFISRRSRYRQGCRFTKRGVDENGHVANFVETEQILIFPDKITSYVQVRGSIPVKWSSPVHMRYDPEVFIDPNRSLSGEWATKHVAELLNLYSDENMNASIDFINLVDGKKDQGKLGVAFKETLDLVKPHYPNTNLQYVWFDFHKECKQKGKWNNLKKLILQVDDTFRYQKFFAKMNDGKVISWQRGVIRTNCMDNLDRTNVVQSLFARRSLLLQAEVGYVLNDSSISVLESPFKSFEKVFKTVWANNADAMSFGYAGTGALKVDFTKTGKRTLQGMFNDGVNSCMRYYINNFTDGSKQDGIDLMLGNYHVDINNVSPFQLRSTRETLADNVTKVFVLMMIIFSTLLLILPVVLPYLPTSSNELDGVNTVAAIEINLRHLKMNLAISFSVTVAVVMYVIYLVVKKGSKIGDKLVLHPELLPEPLPPVRSH